MAIIKKGITTLVWGSSGSLNAASGNPSNPIVEKISITPKNKGPIGDIENGDGASVTLILLDDGFSASCTLEYDTALTWPNIGDTAYLTLPKVGAAGGTTVYNCCITSLPPDIARRRNQKIEINVEYRPGIALT